MGKVATRINFHSTDWKVKEVLSASDLSLFNIKNLKEIAYLEYNLLEVDNGTYLVELVDGRFIEFV